jgi:hypothetical protein
MFDKAHTEIFRLMARDPFPRFLKSDLAITFAKIAKIQDLNTNDDIEPMRSSRDSGQGSLFLSPKDSRRTMSTDLGTAGIPGLGSNVGRGGGGAASPSLDADTRDSGEDRAGGAPAMVAARKQSNAAGMAVGDVPSPSGGSRERRRASKADLADMLAD